MATKTLQYDSRKQMDARLARDVQRAFGNGVFVEDINETEEAIHARLGLELPELLPHAGGGSEVLSFLPLQNVDRLRFGRHDRLRSNAIDRNRFFQHAQDRRNDLIRRAEEAMVGAAKEQIIKVQPVGSGLNPIKEILIAVNEEHSLEARLIEAKKRKMYLPLLEGLGYIKESKGVIHPGPHLQKFPHAKGEVEGSPAFYDRLLGDVLERGYREIHDVIGGQHVVPIVRTANAYYWPAKRVGKQLEYTAQDFMVQLKRLHPSYKVTRLKLYNHLIDIAGAGILKKEGSKYTADPRIWEQYGAQASSAMLA